MSNTNAATASTPGEQPSALVLGPRKEACHSDPLVHHGRHFGRTVHAMTNFKALITKGLLRMGELADEPEDSFSAEERREHAIFNTLLQSIPGLEDRLMNGSAEEVAIISELLQKGASAARSDDTKGLKGPILDWITPLGQSLDPPLGRNVKVNRGFHHDTTGALLCPAGLDWSDPEIKARLRSGEMAIAGDYWPLFLYRGCIYDPADPWNGLFRSQLLVSAFKHIFTSPSSVDKEPKATRAGNARIHGMTRVTSASIAYVATQVRFALSSASMFSRTDIVMDSERFYNSVFELFEDVDEYHEVNSLITWWNRQIFPSFSSAQTVVSRNSALAKIKEKRAALKAAALANRTAANASSGAALSGAATGSH
ncbi:hypothetical protein BV25DRAFT_1873190 [Artomyces pyxidatus]|uniref:Uncharacterized protein n=1 Tax=Artomyces pyxidatus TaxID=48021 RepID=A0ACB8SG14_9AGAM|nr:hypothetical protein BV25DRAFT_1873190 [Artomyces pyxidatus]